MNPPKANLVHIGLFGRRNAGKSSLLNALLGQDLAIVSEVPGTTTDPVEKTYELQPVGPVVFIDTAGIDDLGELGEKRIQKTKNIMKRTDLALLILDQNGLGPAEEKAIELFQEGSMAWLIVRNKSDLEDAKSLQNFVEETSKKISKPVIVCSSEKKIGIENLKNALVKIIDELTPQPPLVSDLVTSPDLVVLVIPIDKEAPKGRIILPQVQALRELLDASIPVVVVKESELHYTLKNVLRIKPKLVITDSQAFEKVDAEVPKDIYLTSFSILLARQKGDLQSYLQGVKVIETLKNGDRVLISELCSHRPIGEDIGRIKIPRWLKQFRGLDLKFDVSAGKDHPIDLTPYKLIIQCGGCVANRSLILSRLRDAKKQNVPITNYGITIAYLHGILDRAVEIFS